MRVNEDAIWTKHKIRRSRHASGFIYRVKTQTESNMSEQQTENTLEIRLTSTEKDGVTYFEGSTEIAGLSRAKLTRADGTTKFTTTGSLRQAANRLATKQGYSGVTVNDAAFQRKAAKRASAAVTSIPASL